LKRRRFDMTGLALTGPNRWACAQKSSHLTGPCH
jgi:hypothetical protein